MFIFDELPSVGSATLNMTEDRLPLLKGSSSVFDRNAKAEIRATITMLIFLALVLFS